ncbi:hypothetical protein GCM10010149_03010 [Nonomuraea roseoviolacea subsp. roseoviolacea]|uniref:Phosphopantetheinyl transferase (Holo-ACP synthase) n=1 Tax=Nonomuraea roseoviolacea subsp. carminata TaxID=160689 RepID=A0ABT1K515_9ACTN|nr:phosphopantetheinyl transferase [Nonomuraea roseoviolacea]MCP2348970.1 phosphopantetheinyl transferase (holo-ACP synthase) [Nonomuraea roseoviolacea subsp. carminata]
MNRWGSALVCFAGLTRPQQLVAGMRLEEVYTAAERVRSAAGASVQHWAGRLAGKRAVLRLLDLPPTAERLGQVEVLPRPTASCRATAACRDGHPPAVRLAPPLAELVRPGDRVRLSISHTDGRALAVALRSTRLPEDEET